MSGAGDPVVQLCAFRVGGQEYAIDLMRVREIIQPLAITPVPRAPEYVEGVVNLRGEIIPVIDVRKRLGAPPEPAGRQNRFLIVNIAGRILGLAVDAVVEVLRIRRSEIRPAPALVGSRGPRLFLGVCGGRAERRGESVRVAAPRPGRHWTPPVLRSGPRIGQPRLRLLVNVKALLEPTTPGELAATAELAGAGRSP